MPKVQHREMASTELHFSYVFEADAEPRRPLSGRVLVSSEVEADLLGLSPVLEWQEITPEPWKLYARVSLRASETGSPLQGISFVIERGLLTMLRAGDLLHLSAAPRMALSIVRGGYLLAAAGSTDALIKLPLGCDVQLRFATPDERARYRPSVGPGMRYNLLPPDHLEADHPVAVTAAGETEVFWWGRPKIGAYEFLIRQTRRRAGPLISIERMKVCPETAAHTTAQLLDREDVQLLTKTPRESR